MPLDAPEPEPESESDASTPKENEDEDEDVDVQRLRAMDQLRKKKQKTDDEEDDSARFDNFSTKKQYVLEISRNDYKGLYRLLRLIRESLWSSFQVHEMVSFPRFNNYDIELVKSNASVSNSLETELHSFIDRINFYLLRVLAFIRSIPGLEEIRLLDIAMNEQAADHFAALVAGLWKDCFVEKGLQFQTEYVLQEGDDLLIKLHLDYFRALTEVPGPNLVFQDVESFNFDEFEKADETILDKDMFETWKNPYNFFARLVMQALHQHDADDLRTVYDNMLVSRTDRKDASVNRMMDVVFTGQTARGYKDALSLVVERLRLSNSKPLLEWIARSMDYTAYFAHLVALCTNHSSMTHSKAGAREALLRRIDISTEAILGWIQDQYKKDNYS
jgi:hypothetical protein